MKTKHNHFIFSFCLLAILQTSFIYAQDTAPVDEKSILSDVINMKDEQTAQKNPVIEKAIAECYQASFSNFKAITFYSKTYKEVEFPGGGTSFTQFKEWEKRNARLLSNTDFQMAVRLHLLYVCYTLKKATGTPNSELLNDLIAYSDAIAMSSDAVKQHGIFRQSINQSIFIKRYALRDALLKLTSREWEYSPANIDLIWTKTIMPELIKAKDQRAVDYWDKKLKQISASAPKDSFNQVQKPEILWSKAETLLAIGKRNQALNEMHQIVKQWPSHPKRETWLNTLQSAITNPEVGTVFR